MKKQRWDGDYQTKEQEFIGSKRQEQIGMDAVNASFGNDYMTSESQGMDRYIIQELEPSWCTQLDMVGMQPHSREYLEYCANNIRSEHCFQEYTGQSVDHPGGIQFSGTP